MALASGALLAEAPDTPALEERWYRVELGGQHAGSLVERVTLAAGTRTSESELRVSLSRGSTSVSLVLSSRFVETREGEPLEMWARQQMGQLPLEISTRFETAGVRQRTVQGESVTEQELPLPEGPWLTPGAAERLLVRRLAEGAESVSFRAVEPLLGPRSFEITYTRLGGPVKLALGEETVTAIPFREVSGAEPGMETTAYFDGEGRVVKTEAPLMGLPMVITLTTEAQARVHQPQAAPELLVRSFVRPDRLLSSPRALRRAVYRLSLAGASLPAIPETSAQTVEREGASAVVTVTATAPQSSQATLDPRPFLEASPYLNFRDPNVERLWAEALARAPKGKAERAERLRAFVHRRLRTKDLATGFATASEVAVRLSGDCTEHAILLAALLRADGIPSRVVSGLLYVEEFIGERNLFGYHMWTEAWLDGRWVDLDAMLEEPFDAAHIALAVSDFNQIDSLVGTSAELMSAMGKLTLEVKSTVP